MIKEGERDATLKYLATAPSNRLAINSYTDGRPRPQLTAVSYISSDTLKQSRHKARTSADTPTTLSSAPSHSPTHTLITFAIPAA
jgi:hypothetical protein